MCKFISLILRIELDKITSIYLNEVYGLCLWTLRRHIFLHQYMYIETISFLIFGNTRFTNQTFF